MTDTKRVIVTGATGMIGRQLCKQLTAKGYQVVAFSRNPQKARQSVPHAAEYVAWTPSEDGAWASAIDGAHGVIHLAGASLFGKRWTDAYKREIMASREIGTRGLVNAMRGAQQKPDVFVSVSAVGYYGPHGDETLDESAGSGNDFLARVCQVWEREARPAEDLGVRTVLFRSGVVLGGDEKMSLPIDFAGASLNRPGVILKTEEGAFPLLVMPFYFFAGGPILPGTQYLSWIHIDDVVGLLMFALEDERVRGPFNATAPDPLTYSEMAKTIGRVMGRPSWVPVPGFALKLMLGEMADMITTGQRVLPKKAQELGYQFKHPTAGGAVREILGK
ncbi:MAG TPA: TIGR01777 family oxidoreductase [Roseiflexaceae bacterium]|nr:TIGR01777 family oxidoreductase [Roseiflexaceae bacterium]